MHLQAEGRIIMVMLSSNPPADEQTRMSYLTARPIIRPPQSPPLSKDIRLPLNKIFAPLLSEVWIRRFVGDGRKSLSVPNGRANFCRCNNNARFAYIRPI
jgi:hypothetical protein